LNHARWKITQGSKSVHPLRTAISSPDQLLRRTAAGAGVISQAIHATNVISVGEPSSSAPLVTAPWESRLEVLDEKIAGGSLLIANDPYTGGVKVEKGKLILPNEPGLGVRPA